MFNDIKQGEISFHNLITLGINFRTQRPPLYFFFWAHKLKNERVFKDKSHFLFPKQKRMWY